MARFRPYIDAIVACSSFHISRGLNSYSNLSKRFKRATAIWVWTYKETNLLIGAIVCETDNHLSFQTLRWAA